jgi:hypothetical protein
MKAKNDYAMVVGINKYVDEEMDDYDRNADYNNLSVAEDDASSVARWLMHETGGNLPESNVSLLLGSEILKEGYKSPFDMFHDFYDEFERRLIALMTTAVKSNTANRFYFYYSGHGATRLENQDEILLVGPGYDFKHDRMSYINLSLYMSWVKSCDAFDEVFLFLDCCRLKQAASKRQISDPSPLIQKVPVSRDRELTPTKGTLQYVSYACMTGHKAFEGKRLGYFTQTMLGGLTSRATVSSGGAPPGELKVWLEKYTPTFSNAHGGINTTQKVEVVNGLKASSIPLGSEKPDFKLEVTFDNVTSGQYLLVEGCPFHNEESVRLLRKLDPLQNSIVTDRLPNGLYRIAVLDSPTETPPFERWHIIDPLPNEYSVHKTQYRPGSKHGL